MNTTNYHNLLCCKHQFAGTLLREKKHLLSTFTPFFFEVRKQREAIHWRGTAKRSHSNRFDWSMDASKTILDVTDVTIVTMLLLFLEFEAQSHCEVSVWTNLNVEVQPLLGPKGCTLTSEHMESTRRYSTWISGYCGLISMDSTGVFKMSSNDERIQVFDMCRPPVLSMWELNRRMYICGMITYAFICHSHP